jgi:hypothetical protein
MLEEAFDSLYKSKVHITWSTIYHKRWKMNNKTKFWSITISQKKSSSMYHKRWKMNNKTKFWSITISQKKSSLMYHKWWKNELQNQVLKHYDLTKKTPSAKRIVLDEKDEKWTTKPSFEKLQSHKKIKFNVP